jgi:hypothetical protein
MFQILDTATLLRLMDATPDAVRGTIERGEWSGCLWPGHSEWEMHEACVQLYSLGVHYFTMRQPEAEARQHAIAAQVLASQGCPQGGTSHLDVDPRVDQALIWLWALAGGLEANGPLVLPGNDAAAFTTTALDLLEALVFSGETAAHPIAVAFLQAHPDAQAQRALELMATLTRREVSQTVDTGVTCAHCGAEGLEMWYTGQTWGETLCEPCYEARVATGQAQPHEL